MGERVGRGLGGAFTALAAAGGLVVGLRSVVALEWPGVRPLFRLPGIPVERLDLPWSPDALWPAELQAQALERMAGLLAALFLAALSVALLNALVLLVEAGTARWREVAVRSALGATPLGLVGLLLAQLRRLVVAGLALGLLLGLATGGAIRAAWPGALVDVDLLSATATLGPLLAGLAGMAASAYAAVGLRAARRGVLAPALASGERTTSDRGAVFLRRALSALQSGVAGAVLLASLALVLSVDRVRAGPEAEGVRLIPVTAPPDAEAGHWAALLERLEALPGVEAGSLATPGALVGLGVRDAVTAQCGDCWVGGLPLGFRVAVADHHAVTPGFLEAAGVELVAGRDLADRSEAARAPEALVNRTFARSSFQDGEPVGRKIRVGTSLDRWYTVVGVVADEPVPVVGGDEARRAGVWIDALREEPRVGHLVYRGTEEADRPVAALLTVEGYAPGEPRSLEEHRARAAAPLGWLRWMALALGASTLLLALHGAHATALQVTRRQRRELALRRVVGASDRRIALHVVRGAAGVGTGAALLAVFFGALLVAALRTSAAGVAPLGAGAYLGVAALLVAAGVSASVRAVGEAVAVPPAAALREGRPDRRNRSGTRRV